DSGHHPRPARLAALGLSFVPPPSARSAPGFAALQTFWDAPPGFMKGLPTVALAGLLLVPGCLNVERASACRELSASLKESFGTERTLETAEDVKGFVAELEALEARIEPWLTSPTWQGSDLTVFSVELGR